MGMGATGQQGSQVYYDPDMGQYYTQTTPHSNMTSLFMGNLSPLQNQNSLQNMMTGKNTRNYINGMMNQSSPALQQSAPYQYADVSLESLFPMIHGALQSSQGGALDGLLSGVAQSATNQAQNAPASSGAGRFM
jgi:hypothetical protein